MANLAAIRARYEQAKADNTRGGVSDKYQDMRTKHLLKLEEGKVLVRMVPNPHNDEDPFVTGLFYYNYGRKTLMSPLQKGLPDPISEFIEQALSGPKVGKETFKEYMGLKPKTSWFCPVVVVGKEAEGLKWLKLSKGNYEILLDLFVDVDYGDLTDPQSGKNIEIEYIPKEKSKTSYAETTLKIKPKDAPLTKEVLALSKNRSALPPIEELYEIPSYDQLDAYFSAYIKNSAPAEPEKTAGTKLDAEFESATDALFVD